MRPALYRDKDGQTVDQFPFILVIDPILNQGRIFQDEEAVDLGFADDDLLDDATPETILPMLAARGNRIYYLRSEADLEDDLLPYFAVADGQLQEIMAAVWVRQDFGFEGGEHVAWEATTTRLYTDGETIFCEGHEVTLTLAEDDPLRPVVETRARALLEAYAAEVAKELRAPLAHVTPRTKR